MFIILLSFTVYLSPFGVNVSADTTATAVINPTADAYGNSTSSSTNYGSDISLCVAANTQECYTYLKYDLSVLPVNSTIVSAYISAYFTSKIGTVYMGESIGAYYSSDDSWTEGGLTWDSSPAFNATPTSIWTFMPGESTGYKTWDVTVDAQTALAGEIGLTEVLKFTSKVGFAQVFFQSRETANKPALHVEYTTTGEPDGGDGIGLSGFALQFAANDVNVIYPSDSSSKPLGCVAAWVSDWMASAFVTTKLSSYAEGLDIDSGFVDQVSGRAVGAAGQGIISFGGPVVNPVVNYAEKDTTITEERAPIKFYGNATDFFFQLRDGTAIAGATLPASVINNNEDMFVIEVFTDVSGRYVMLCYGFGWKGTYAAGKYFDTVIYPDLASYTANWIIVKWQDTNGDGFVNNPIDGDTYTVVAASN